MLAYELQYWFTLQTPGSGADDQERGRSERCLEQAPVSCISFSNCAKVQRPCAELKKPALFLLRWFKKIIIKNAHSYPCINRGPKAGGRQSLAVPLATHCTSSSPSYVETMPPHSPCSLLQWRREGQGQGRVTFQQLRGWESSWRLLLDGEEVLACWRGPALVCLGEHQQKANPFCLPLTSRGGAQVWVAILNLRETWMTSW